MVIFSTDYTDIHTAKEVAAKFRSIVGDNLPGYLNLSSDESIKDSQSSRTIERARDTYGEKNFARLKEIKAVYDPKGSFRSWFA